MNTSAEPDGSPAVAQAPFFIVGAGRSGTTLLRMMLDAHPRLTVPPESHFIVSLVRRFGPQPTEEAVGALLDHPRFVEWEMDAEPLRQRWSEQPPASWRQLFGAVYALYAAKQGKPRWGDKTPDYAHHLPLLRQVFPGARFIHIVRDGRDVACSLTRVPWYDGSFADMASTWVRAVSCARRHGQGHDDYFEIRYEDLVRSPEEMLRAVCAHVGEEYTPTMLDYSRRASERLPEHRQAWHRRISRPLDDSRIGVWQRQLSAADLFVFEHYGGPLLAELGYPQAASFSPLGAARLVARRVKRIARLTLSRTH